MGPCGIIIKNEDITEWSYNDVHEELERLIHEFELIGNNHWAHLNQELLVDYKIHTPKKDNNNNNNVNNKQKEIIPNQILKNNWFQDSHWLQPENCSKNSCRKTIVFVVHKDASSPFTPLI